MKKVILIIILLLIVAGCLCACDNSAIPPKRDPDPWEKQPTTDPKNVYREFLASVFNISNRVTVTGLTVDPRLAVEASFLVSVNNVEFWAQLRANYDDTDRAGAMVSLFFSSKEDSYKDMTLGFFVYKETLYIAVGQSKIKVPFSESAWNDYFPLKATNNNSEDIANGSVILSQVIEVKGSMKAYAMADGTNALKKFVFDVNLPMTVLKLQNLLSSGSAAFPPEMLDIYETLIANLFGIPVSQVATNFPQADVHLEFITTNTRLSGLDFKIDVKKPTGEPTLLGDEDIKLTVKLKKLDLKSFSRDGRGRVSIDFVNDTNMQAQYSDYLNSIFRFDAKLLVPLPISAGDKTVKYKPYDLIVLAKTFQAERDKDFLFIEFKNDQNVVEHGAYFYNDFAYFAQAGAPKLKVNLKLADQTEKVFYNGYADDDSVSADFIISYVLGTIRLGANDITFLNTARFIENVWKNLDDFEADLNEKYDVDIFAADGLKDFMTFITKTQFNLTVDFSKNYLTAIKADDAEIQKRVRLIGEFDLALNEDQIIYFKEEED